MGNFSRPPEQRLDDATSKHYVGVRVEQGVPLLDADLHLLDGLHRNELEQVGRWMLGNGVPVGSDAFRVIALAGGGVNTVVLRAVVPGTGVSTLSVDLTSSTSVAALGFGSANSSATGLANQPAQLMTSKAGPFALANGMTLVVSANGQAPETVTFQTADFVNIAAATAAEVATKINTVAAGVTAAAGDGNDFFMTGGDGTIAGAGRILVDGRMALIERGLRYREQALYMNAALALAWGVDQVGDIPMPSGDEVQTVFIDVWHREVARAEDVAIVDPRIDIQTAVSLRREWAVRVVPTANFAATLAARPAGHAYYRLTELHRTGSASITEAMIVDVRDTDASLRPEIAYRNQVGVVVVDNQRFRNVLTLTRDAARGLITYITTQFVQPSSTPLMVGETVGIETLTEIANLTDHALALVNARALGTRGALGIMQQLYDAEKRFLTVWQTTVLPLMKSGVQVYQNTFGISISVIESFLDGPAPGGNLPIATALPVGNLDGALSSQERIALELNDQAQKPLGGVSLKYLGSTSLTVSQNAPLDLKFEVSGLVHPDDDLDVQVFIDLQWAVTLKNGNGSTPFAMQSGPGQFTKQMFVSVTPPNVASGQTLFSVQIHARKNPIGVAFITPQRLLKIGSPPPLTEEQYALVILLTALQQDGAGIYQVVKNNTGHITFQIQNNTNADITVDYVISSSSPDWTAQAGGMGGGGPATVPAHTTQPTPQFNFKAPNTAGVTTTCTLQAVDHANPTSVYAEVMVTLTSTNS